MRNLLPSILVALIASALTALALVPACKTDEQTGELVPDWAAIDKELDLAAEDLLAAQEAFPDHAEAYAKLGEALIDVDVVIEDLEAGAPINLAIARGALDAAQKALEKFEGEEWAFLLGATLRRVSAYLPLPPTPPAE